MPLRVRTYARRSLRWLGDPILPDTFNAASGESFSFSPGTPDATIMAILTQAGQQLPANLAAAWAAGTPAAAVTPSGQPVSTQTAAAVTLVNTLNIAPGVWLCTMSDGSQHYCDQNANPISYTPPPSTPATTPAASSQPASTTTPSATTTPQTASTPATTPVAVTASGTPISTTTGTPTTAPATTSGDIMFGSFDFTAFLTQSAIGGIPNWVLLAGGAAALLMFGSGGSRRR